MRIYTLGAVAIMGYMGFLQFVISQGATKQAMIFVVLGALMNIVLDPILIFGFHMGVAGAAIATVLSQLLIAVLSIWFLAGETRCLPWSYPRRSRTSCPLLQPSYSFVVLSAMGILTPITGALWHNCGSVFVVVNAALLLRVRDD